jgi:hypothetical protein
VAGALVCHSAVVFGGGNLAKGSALIFFDLLVSFLLLALPLRN